MELRFKICVRFWVQKCLHSTVQESDCLFNTRLRSSGMRTACALTVSPSMLCIGGGCLLWGVSAPGGVCSWGDLLLGRCLLWGGVCSGGFAWGSAHRGVSAPRGVCSKGGLLRGVYLVPRGCTWSGTPPVDRHTPVNILPCPKLRLRAVISGQQLIRGENQRGSSSACFLSSVR